MYLSYILSYIYHISIFYSAAVQLRVLLVYIRVWQWRWRRKLFKSKAVSSTVDRNTETVIFRFFCCPGGILERQELFHMIYVTLKPVYVYVPLFMGNPSHLEYAKWDWDSDLFWFGDGPICAGFPPLCVLKVPRLANFFIASKNCIFWGATFGPMKNLATIGTRNLQGFRGTPPYTIVTP